MVCTMLATPTSGDASRGRRAAKMPSGTPSADGDERRRSDQQDVLAEQGRELGAMREPERRTAPSSGRGAARPPPVEQPQPRGRAAPRAALEQAGARAGRVDAATTLRRDRTRSAGPSSSTPTRSASANASPMSCVTMIDRLAQRDPGCGETRACSSARVSGSSAPNGSSISSTGGSTPSARATPTRCRWPPDNSSGQRSANSLRAAGRRARAARRPARSTRSARPSFEARHDGDVVGDGHDVETDPTSCST